MITMKRAAFFSVLLLVAVSAFATPPPTARHFANPLLDDVVQMSRAGLSDDTIVAYVRSRRSRLDAEVTANDLIDLQRAGVSEKVIGYIGTTVGIQEPHAAPNSTPPNSVNYNAGDGSDEGAYPVDPQSNADVTYSNESSYEYASYPYWYAWAPAYSWGWWGWGWPSWRWGWWGWPSWGWGWGGRWGWGWGHGWRGGWGHGGWGHGWHGHGFSHGTFHGGGHGGGHMGGHFGGGHGGHH